MYTTSIDDILHTNSQNTQKNIPRHAFPAICCRKAYELDATLRAHIFSSSLLVVLNLARHWLVLQGNMFMQIDHVPPGFGW